MRHLAPEELIDLIDGSQPDASSPHLVSCEACRRQLAELRAVMTAAAEVDVPEPSPFFWDHLSTRVRDAVAAEGTPRHAWLGRFDEWSRRRPVPLFGSFGLFGLFSVSAAAVALIVAVAVMSSRGVPSRQTALSVVASAPAVAAAVPSNGGSSSDALVDDPAFEVVSDLTAGIDMDTALAAGLVADGSAEHAVTHLDDNELRELQRLLKEEIAHSPVS